MAAHARADRRARRTARAAGRRLRQRHPDLARSTAGPGGETLEWRLHPVSGFRPPRGVGPYDLWDEVTGQLASGATTRRRCRSATTAARSHRCGTASSATRSTTRLEPAPLAAATTEVLGIAPDAAGLVDHERIGERVGAGPRRECRSSPCCSKSCRTPSKEPNREPSRPRPCDLRRQPPHGHVHARAPAPCRASTSTSTGSRATRCCSARSREAMAPAVPEGTEMLAGLELGGVPIATMLSQVTGIPALFVRKEAKTLRHLPARRGRRHRRTSAHGGRGRRHLGRSGRDLVR